MLFDADCSSTNGNMIWIEKPYSIRRGIDNDSYHTNQTSTRRVLINPRNINYIISDSKDKEYVHICMVNEVVICCLASELSVYLENSCLDFCDWGERQNE